MTHKAINPVWVFAEEALKAAAWGALTGAMPTISEIKETEKRIERSKKGAMPKVFPGILRPRRFCH